MKSKTQRFQSCNVLEVSAAGRRLWHFSVGKDSLKPAGDLTLEAGKPLPKRTAGKDWQTLFQPRLDLGWLPAEHVFIRVVQLPAADPAELPGMVEFQLEKLSPLPITHIVWTVETMPHPDGRNQTALVVIAARDKVEAFLGEQAKDGYIVDGFDVPLLRELRLLKPEADGVWVLLDPQVTSTQALVGWHVGGVWQDVAMLQLPAGPAAAETLVRCLNQSAWSGELEGWLAGLPPVQLRAKPEDAAIVEEPLRAWSGQPVTTDARPDRSLIAAASARTRLAERSTALVPEEITSRQRAAFVDRIWMRGIGGVFVAYVFLVFLYLIALNVRKYQLDEVKGDAVGLARQYTNSLQLKAQVAVLQDQIALKFAALDAWRAVVDELPESLTLSQLDFSNGQTVEVNGTVAVDNQAAVTDFNKKLKAVQVNGQPLFATVNVPEFPTRTAAGAVTTTWRFKAELKKAEVP